MKKTTPEKLYYDWIDGLKAFALFGVLLNHFVEEFGRGPWFTNPSENWPDFGARMHGLFPGHDSVIPPVIRFFGWLGDSAPGIFILLSGAGLTLGALVSNKNKFNTAHFYQKRLLRLYPLYITTHLLLLAGALFLSNQEYGISSYSTLLSLLGLRFTDSLFFYVNPSWWFVWLILQLYLIFPVLLKLLTHAGLKKFLVITFLVTFLFRALGIIGIRYSHSLYYWMTGIFFGTRLAEFTAGMGLAVLLQSYINRNNNIPGSFTVFRWSIIFYVIGFSCSLTWIGSIFSNLLVTIGLSGIFFSIYQGLIKQHLSLLIKPLTWIGARSYSVYLSHQVPLHWTGTIFYFSNVLHLVSAIVVIIFSFPIGLWLEKLINSFQKQLPELKSFKYAQLTSLLLSIFVLVNLILVEPEIWSSFKLNILHLSLVITFIVLIFLEQYSTTKEIILVKFFRWTAFLALVLSFYAFPKQFVPATVIFSVPVSLFAVWLFSRNKKRIKSWGIALIIALIGIGITEYCLSCFAPLEVDGKWGELAALQRHPTRVYALKPNQETHLKYNNYNYILRTNSFGLVSPEIQIDPINPGVLRIYIIGDAFSMPEGLQYEKSYPAHLEKKIAEYITPLPVQVINGAVTGYGPVEQLAQLRELAPVFKPGIMVHQFFINDFTEAAITPENRLENIGLVRKNQFFVSRLVGFSQILEYYSRIQARCWEQFTKKPGTWRYAKSLLQYYKMGENPVYSKANLDKLSYHLQEMKKVANDQGAALIIYFVPAAIAVSQPSALSYFPWDVDLTNKETYDPDRPLKTLVLTCKKFNIPVLDLTPYLKNHPIQPVYFPDSWHWNEEGHRLVARVIFNSLRTEGYLDIPVK